MYTRAHPPPRSQLLREWWAPPEGGAEVKRCESLLSASSLNAGWLLYEEDGTPMVYELLTSFQGRIDASYLYGMNKREILYAMGFRSLLWDPEVYEYHNTSVSRKHLIRLGRLRTTSLGVLHLQRRRECA